MSPRTKLAFLLALAALPLLEIGVLIRLGQAIGFARLALLVIATAILGTIVIRRVGVSMVSRALQGIERGRDGLGPILDGFLQVVAGMLLIFPGLISDAIGILLLVPPLRHWLISSGILKIFGSVSFEGADGRYKGPEKTSDGKADDDAHAVTIEGEYERLSEKTIPAERAVRRTR